MLYTLVSNLLFKNAVPTRMTGMKIFIIGSVLYVLLSYYLNTQTFSIKYIESYKKYLMILMVVDLFIQNKLMKMTNIDEESDDEDSESIFLKKNQEVQQIPVQAPVQVPVPVQEPAHVTQEQKKDSEIEKSEVIPKYDKTSKTILSS